MENSKRLSEALHFAESFAVSSRVEFLTPELLLVGICCRNNEFMALCDIYHVDYQKDLKEPIYSSKTKAVSILTTMPSSGITPRYARSIIFLTRHNGQV